jgi:hypothetical protein
VNFGNSEGICFHRELLLEWGVQGLYILVYVLKKKWFFGNTPIGNWRRCLKVKNTGALEINAIFTDM